MSQKIKVRLVRSLIGKPRKQREVIRGLGLRRINHEVIREDRPEVWGMIKKVRHLVEVETIEIKKKEKKKKGKVSSKER